MSTPPGADPTFLIGGVGGGGGGVGGCGGGVGQDENGT